MPRITDRSLRAAQPPTPKRKPVQTDEDAPVMLMAMALLSATSRVDMKSSSIVIDETGVRVFDNDPAAAANDLNACYTAYADAKAKRVIKRNNKAKRPTALTVNVVKGFYTFDNSGVERFYHYKGKPISAYCRRADLIEIVTAR